MEKIPVQWERLRRKAGGDETSSILDLVWNPGYEEAYQQFLDWVRNATSGYLAGVGELRFVTHAPGWQAPLTFTPSVWNSAVSLKEQARSAFSQTIRNAIAGSISQEALEQQLYQQWTMMQGTRHAEVDSRLRTLSHSAMGWYKSFLRRYLIQAASAEALFAIWRGYVKKVVSFYIDVSWKAAVIKFPKTMRAVGYGLRPLADLRMFWINKARIAGALAKKFITALKSIGGKGVGITYGLDWFKYAMPVGAGVAGILGGLLAVLLTNFQVDAPTLDSDEVDAIYSNPNWALYRQEVARAASSVHDAENAINAIKQKKTSPVKDEAAPEFDTTRGYEAEIALAANSIHNIRLTIGDEALDPVRDELTRRLRELSGGLLQGAAGPGMTYEYFKERGEQESPVSDAVVESYYDAGAILEILAPGIERLLDGRDPDSLTDEEIQNIVNEAAALPGAFDNYAEQIAGRITKEQQVNPESDVSTLALDTAIEAADRLENLIAVESQSAGEYQQVISQLATARNNMDGDASQAADDLIASTRDILTGLGEQV